MTKFNERMRPVPIQFGNDPSIWAAWLYYVESLTQAEIAVILGVSRASVVNYLAEARRNNLVSVSLTKDLLGQIAIGKELSQRYSLQSAYITPSRGKETSDASLLRQQLGIAGAHALVSLIKNGVMIGVASGRTMLELGKALPKTKPYNASIVQVSGASLRDEITSPDACITMIANRLQANCYNLHAPAVVTSTSLRNALLKEPLLERHFGRIRKCDTVVYSVGELTPETRMAEEEMLMRPSLDTYMKKGAVAILIGRLIDAGGQEIDGPLSGCQIGVELDDLRAIPARLCVAGGAEKVTAIRAILAGGYATHLVTNEITAQELLKG